MPVYSSRSRSWPQFNFWPFTRRMLLIIISCFAWQWSTDVSQKRPLTLWLPVLKNKLHVVVIPVAKLEQFDRNLAKGPSILLEYGSLAQLGKTTIPAYIFEFQSIFDSMINQNSFIDRSETYKQKLEVYYFCRKKTLNFNFPRLKPR